MCLSKKRSFRRSLYKDYFVRQSDALWFNALLFISLDFFRLPGETGVLNYQSGTKNITNDDEQIRISDGEVKLADIKGKSAENGRVSALPPVKWKNPVDIFCSWPAMIGFSFCKEVRRQTDIQRTESKKQNPPYCVRRISGGYLLVFLLLMRKHLKDCRQVSAGYPVDVSSWFYSDYIKKKSPPLLVTTNVVPTTTKSCHYFLTWPLLPSKTGGRTPTP